MELEVVDPRTMTIKVLNPQLGSLIILRIIIIVLHPIVLTLAAGESMANVGAWSMLSGGGCVLVFEMDGRWKTTMEGEWGIPLSFQLQNRTKLRSSTIYVGSTNNILIGPHAQLDQNNT